MNKLSEGMQWNEVINSEIVDRVDTWLAEGRMLFWLPILTQENFPDIPPELLYYADQCPERCCWGIKTAEDYYRIPNGITGWLLPEGDKDTDVVIGRWKNSVYFLRLVDPRTGARQTLQSGKPWNDAESAGDPADGVRI